MNKNTLYIYLTAFIALLIQTPGRFVYGVVLMLELLSLIITGTLALSFIKKIKLDELKSVLLLIILVAFTILFRQILVISYSEIALTLGYILYFPTISIFLLNSLVKNTDKPLLSTLLSNLMHSIIFLFLGLLFFLLRDIAGYGTFTFFGKNHMIYEKILLNTESIGIFSFIASIPGALILSGLLLFIYMLIAKKFKILKNMEQQQ